MRGGVRDYIDFPKEIMIKSRSDKILAGGSGLQGKVLLGHKERFFLHIFHTGKVFFGTKKLSLAFLVRRPITEERFLLDTGKVPFGHREVFWTKKLSCTEFGKYYAEDAGWRASSSIALTCTIVSRMSRASVTGANGNIPIESNPIETESI